MSHRTYLIPLLGVLACAAPTAEPMPLDPGTAEDELRAVWAAYATAAKAGDVAAIEALYDAEPTVIESGLPTMRGAAALRETATGVFASVRIIESAITPRWTDLAGTTAYQYGDFHDVIEPVGAPRQEVFGRFSAVLSRDSTAQWRIRAVTALIDSTVASDPR